MLSSQINNGQRYDVLVCQRPGTRLDTNPVWIRAVMIDDDFPELSAYNASLGILYYTPTRPQKLPETQASFNPPILTPSQVPVPGLVVNPYFMNPVGGVKPPPATKVLEFTIDFYNETPNDANATQ